MVKKCKDCGLTKSLSDFHITGQSHRANCKLCRSGKDRNDKLRRYYNIDLDTYLVFLDKQGGVCAICSNPETSIDKRTGELRFLAVDHDHACCPGQKTCGQCVRGLLCSRCNVILGLADDDRDLLLDCVLYLRSFNDPNR